MLSNYVRIAVRNFLKNKLHTAINLVGLSAGMVSVFMIAMYVRGELSFDRFHEHAANIYRLEWHNNNPQTRTPHPMAQAMVNDFPQVVSAVSLTPLWGPGLTRETHSFRNLDRDERFDETAILAVDTTFFDVFSFSIIKGDPKNALKKINGLCISESAAKRYFGEEDPIGKQLAVDSDTLLAEVVAVFKAVPATSHFHFDFLVSYLREKSFDPGDSFYSWADFGHFNYVRLAPGADPKELENKLMRWAQKYTGWTNEAVEQAKRSNYTFRLTPITDIHLKSHIRWELEPNGNINYVYILATAGLLTLIIACVNFMNLTTARSTERSKEVGVRTSLGALRRQLATQFIVESVLIAGSAAILALVAIQVVLPAFNQAAGTTLSIQFWPYGIAIIGSGILIGLMAGFYPSIILSRMKPTTTLKGAGATGTTTLRDTLIVFQFAISMALISGSIIIFTQLEFLQDHNLGYDKEGVIVIPLKQEEMPDFEAMKNELLTIDGVTNVSASTNVPGGSFNQHPMYPTASPTDLIDVSDTYVEADFFSTMGIQLKEGRLFKRGSVADTGRVYVINEAAARQFNLTDPIGAEITIDRHDRLERGRVIGVVENFHFQSLHDPLRPLLFGMTDEFSYLVVRTENPANIPTIEKVYRKFDPIFAFDYTFLDSRLEKQYEAESKLGLIMGIFSAVSIIIASFGLFAMALLNFYRKVKEISIRKVLGASPAHLVYLLLRNFTILVAIAIVIATPFTWWVMNGWLQNFNFRITISPIVFVTAAVSLIAICWMTLGFLTVKTSRLNPADVLKSE